MAVSIKELARLAGVSVTTVARALNGKPDINEDTRQRIVSLAEQHHYRPNVLARGLVTSRTYTVGVIVPDITNPFFPAMIKGIEATLWSDGYNVIFADTNYDTAKESDIVDDMIARQVDGIVICPTTGATNSLWLQSVRSADVPAVSVTRLDELLLDTVIAADRDGARSAAEHLIGLGRRQILYLGNESARWADREREHGFRQALSAAGVQDAQVYIRKIAHGTSDEAQSAISSFLSDGTQIDSVLAFDDVMALGARLALVDHGLRVPEDVAIIGFDDISLARLPEVALTTVEIPKHEIGRVAAARVLDRIKEKGRLRKTPGPAASPLETVLSTHLIVRRTCGASLQAAGPGLPHHAGRPASPPTA